MARCVFFSKIEAEPFLGEAFQFRMGVVFFDQASAMQSRLIKPGVGKLFSFFAAFQNVMEPRKAFPRREVMILNPLPRRGYELGKILKFASRGTLDFLNPLLENRYRGFLTHPLQEVKGRICISQRGNLLNSPSRASFIDSQSGNPMRKLECLRYAQSVNRG